MGVRASRGERGTVGSVQGIWPATGRANSTREQEAGVAVWLLNPSVAKPDSFECVSDSYTV